MVDLIWSFDYVTFILIPLLILIARIFDVTLGTIRMIFISKGEKLFSAGIGFFEALIWLVAITRIIDNLTNVYAYFAYAAGFAIGTYLGIIIERKMLIGKVMVRVTTHRDAKELVEELRIKNYTFTISGVEGPDGKVKSLHVIINKKDLHRLIDYIVKYDENAFYSIEDVKIVTENNHFYHTTKKANTSVGK